MQRFPNLLLVVMMMYLARNKLFMVWWLMHMQESKVCVLSCIGLYINVCDAIIVLHIGSGHRLARNKRIL